MLLLLLLHKSLNVVIFYSIICLNCVLLYIHLCTMCTDNVKWCSYTALFACLLEIVWRCFSIPICMIVKMHVTLTLFSLQFFDYTFYINNVSLEKEKKKPNSMPYRMSPPYTEFFLLLLFCCCCCLLQRIRYQLL